MAVVVGSDPTLVGARVLVVEDDAVSAKLVAVILRGEGCDVRIADSADTAFGLVESFAPRVVILDLLLPDMNGLRIAERLRAHAATADVIIIAVSVQGSETVQRAARSAGCDAYVTKPIDSLQFASIVLEHLERRGAS